MPSGINCDPQALVRLADCYRTIPAGMRKDVIIYLLARMAGVRTSDIPGLIEKSRCMKVIPGWMKYEVQLYLICNLL